MERPEPSLRPALGPPLLMGGTRIVNIALGLLLIPLLLHFLGTTGFAAWALYSGGGLILSSLDFGIGRTLVRFLARPLTAGDRRGADTVAVNGVVIAAAFYLAVLALLLPVVGPLVRWLDLPSFGAVDAAHLFLLVTAASGLRSVLELGGIYLYAAQDFRASALKAFLQPFCSNLSAIFAAVAFQRLDLVLLAYWAAQLAVVGGFFVYASVRFQWRLSPRFVSGEMSGRLLRHSAGVQLSVWAMILHFQLDKFIIAGWAGLDVLVVYEIANRALLTLRSIPLTAVETLLPRVSTGPGGGAPGGPFMRQAFSLSMVFVLAFVVAPVAVAPLFIPAWVGQQGVGAAAILVVLTVGVVVELLVLPAVIRMQSRGRPGPYAMGCIAGVLGHAGGSFFGVANVSADDAAITAAGAMAVGLLLGHLAFFLWYIRDEGRLGKAVFGDLLGLLWGPLVIGVLGWMGAWWLAGAIGGSQVGMDLLTRLGAGLLALVVYGVCIGLMGLVLRDELRALRAG